MIHYRITMKFDRPPDFSRRGWKEVQRAAMQAAAEHWDEAMMPGHFEQNARSRYGYQPRSSGYQKSKIKAVMRGKARGGMDMVFSGLTQDSAMKRPLIKAFPTRARVDLLVPSYIKMIPNPHGSRAAAPALGDELTRVIYEEAEELAGVAVGVMQQALAPRSMTTDVFGSRRKTSSRTTLGRSLPAEWAQPFTVICE